MLYLTTQRERIVKLFGNKEANITYNNPIRKISCNQLIIQ